MDAPYFSMTVTRHMSSNTRRIFIIVDVRIDVDVNGVAVPAVRAGRFASGRKSTSRFGCPVHQGTRSGSSKTIRS